MNALPEPGAPPRALLPLRSREGGLLAALLFLTVLRLGYTGHFELAPDEALYTLHSQRPDLAYFAKGPLVGLAIRTGTGLLGATESGVRLLSPLLALGTCLVLYRLAGLLFDRATAILLVVAINALPIFNAGALLMTIDPLSIFFWCCSLLFAWKALTAAPAFTLWWPLTGLAIGLGFLAKYTNAAALAGLLLVLATTPRLRKELARPAFLSCLGAFSLCALPPILWNARHAWISVRHLVDKGDLDQAWAFRPAALLEFTAAHFGVYSPLIFLGIVVALPSAWRAAKKGVEAHSPGNTDLGDTALEDPGLKYRFLLSFSLPLLAAYFLLSLSKAGHANWTAPGVISALVIGTAYWVHRARRSSGARALVAVALALGALLSVVGVNTDLLRRTGISLPAARDPSTRVRGWRQTAQKVERTRRAFEEASGEPVFLIANRYQLASELSFYLSRPRVEVPGHVPVYALFTPEAESQFWIWPSYARPGVDPSPFRGRTALFLSDYPDRQLRPSLLEAFAECRPVDSLEIEGPGGMLRTIAVSACFDFRGAPSMAGTGDPVRASK